MKNVNWTRANLQISRSKIESFKSNRSGAGPLVSSGRRPRAQRKKFLTRSVWLNDNKLKRFKNIDVFVESILEFPEQMGWIDFSFNHISEIDEALLQFPNIKIIYLHGNCLENLDQIMKLRKMKQLKTVTFHGNPFSNLPNYRSYIIAALPQIDNLDFTPVLKNEKLSPVPPEFLRDLKTKLAKEAQKTKKEKL